MKEHSSDLIENSNGSLNVKLHHRRINFRYTSIALELNQIFNKLE